MNTFKKGKIGEESAEKYLIERGYTLVARNFKAHPGEIDLVMTSGCDLVFVEVKAWKNLPFADLDEQLPARGIPTSFFVSREGKIMTYPIVGVPADISQYEKTFDEMLAKAAGGYEPASHEGTSDHKKDSCRIIVRDESGSPVEGVPVQFCSDTACMMGKTDAEGTVSFHAENDRYTVHVQKVPEGFAADIQEYAVPEDLSDVTITLKKA